ncbi:MAG: DUF4118 domain-containing protein [Chloroflexi bacterium]|nr:DUF4118 domain-containing protein [Chloroflexota bacterium]
MSQLRRMPWVGYFAGLAGVAVMSALIHLALEHISIGNISMLYLVIVLAIAFAFGRGPAILVSVAAFLTFDWFFVHPRYTFTVADPAEWIALVLFLLTAIVTGQLAAQQRDRAREAKQREREAVVLYDVVRLMGGPDISNALRAVAERLREELQLAAVSIRLMPHSGKAVEANAGDAESLQRVSSIIRVRTRVLSEGQQPTADRRGSPGRWVRIVPPGLPGTGGIPTSDRLHKVPVRIDNHHVGDIFLVQPPRGARFSAADDRLLSAVSAQLGMVVERERLRREATEAEILRRTDELKSALLNAVSHDLRTPLSSIIASAGSLRQKDVAWTDEERGEFAQAIEEEAQRLNRIVGNLLDLSRIEKGNLRPQKDFYDLGALIDDVLGRLRLVTARHPVEVNVPDDLPPVRRDRPSPVNPRGERGEILTRGRRDPRLRAVR